MSEPSSGEGGPPAARVGPKAAEGDEALPPEESVDEADSVEERTGLSLRAMLPNAITAAALCAGLTAVRFAIDEKWSFAVLAIVVAGLLDGMDGRIARLLNAQSRFGAELDSLADALSFGMAPALILFLWSLEDLTRFGWFAALAYAICCALRLARFNAQIDVEDQPHKSAGFLTGVPAPVGAGLALTPLCLWIETGLEVFREPVFIAIWMSAIGVLFISNMATLSWTAVRPQRDVRIWLIAFVAIMFAGLLLEPWWTLSAIGAGYLVLMPYGLFRYGKIKRARVSENLI
jgi:CDP-diacylglycerol--serine O-phosphatidyltransferase